MKNVMFATLLQAIALLPLPVPPPTSFDGLHMEMNYFDLNRSKVESVRFIRAVRRHYPHGWLSRLFALTGKWSLLDVSRKRTINDNDSEPSERSSIFKVHLQTVPAIAHPKVYRPDRGQKGFTANPSNGHGHWQWKSSKWSKLMDKRGIVNKTKTY